MDVVANQSNMQNIALAAEEENLDFGNDIKSDTLLNELTRLAGFQAVVIAFLHMASQWGQDRVIKAMDQAARDMESYNEYEAAKGKVDVFVSELSLEGKDAKAPLSKEVHDFLWKENPVVGGIPYRDQFKGVPDAEIKPPTIDVGAAKALSIDMQKAGASFGDKNTKNNLEVQQAMTNWTTSTEEIKGFIKKIETLLDSIIRATYS
jgi:hypothetical protein